MGCLKKSGKSGEVTLHGLSIYTCPLKLMASKSVDAQNNFTIYVSQKCKPVLTATAPVRKLSCIQPSEITKTFTEMSISIT